MIALLRFHVVTGFVFCCFLFVVVLSEIFVREIFVVYFSMVWMSAADCFFINFFRSYLCAIVNGFFFNVFYLICNRPFELLLDLPQLKTVLLSVG